MSRVRHRPNEGNSVKRIARYIFDALTVLSLVLLAATVALGIRSSRIADAWGWARPKGALQVGTAHGRLRLSELRLLGVEWDGNSKTSPGRYRVHPMRAFAPALAAMMLLASLAGAPRAPRVQLRGPDVAVIVRADPGVGRRG